MKKVDFKSANAFEWLTVLNDNIPSVRKDNTIIISKDGGQCFIKAIKVQEGMNIIVLDIILNEPITFNRQAHEINTHYVLNLFTSNSFIIKNEEALDILHYGITFYSATTKNKYIVPSNTPIKAFIIDVSISWVQQTITGYNDLDYSEKLKQLLIHNNPISRY